MRGQRRHARLRRRRAEEIAAARRADNDARYRQRRAGHSAVGAHDFDARSRRIISWAFILRRTTISFAHGPGALAAGQEAASFFVYLQRASAPDAEGDIAGRRFAPMLDISRREVNSHRPIDDIAHFGFLHERLCAVQQASHLITSTSMRIVDARRVANAMMSGDMPVTRPKKQRYLISACHQKAQCRYAWIIIDAYISLRLASGHTNTSRKTSIFDCNYSISPQPKKRASSVLQRRPSRLHFYVAGSACCQCLQPFHYTVSYHFYLL